MSNRLDKNILATIIYYDALGYPLTALEVWKHLIRTDYYDGKRSPSHPTLHEVIMGLADASVTKFIERQGGFYFLHGRGDLVEKRIEAAKVSIGKIKSLCGIVRWLRFVPFVRMVGITGALAMKNARPDSDLDILVVLKSGKIWTGRTLLTFIVQLMGKRRHRKKVADRVCLNYFITDESLEVITKDLFSASEYMFIFPLFGWNTFLRFQIKNQWIAAMKPSYASSELKPLKTMDDTPLSKFIRTLGEYVFSMGWIERWLKKMEKKKIMLNPKTHGEGSLVYADDDALVFLPDPHGPKIFERFKEKIGQLSV